MPIIFFFQGWVDGWLTKLSDPIVLYNPSHHVGVRFPWDIPVEDFGFGWAMVTLSIITWVWLGRGAGAKRSADEGLWTWGRVKSSADISPLVAMTVAASVVLEGTATYDVLDSIA